MNAISKRKTSKREKTNTHPNALQKMIYVLFGWASCYTYFAVFSSSNSRSLFHDIESFGSDLLSMSNEISNKEDGVLIEETQDEESTATSTTDNADDKVEEDITDIQSTKNYPFKKYDGPVFVTKVLRDAEKDVHDVLSMICYIQNAYNDKMLYDIIVFTTMPWKEENIKKAQEMAGNAKVIVTVEGPTLEEHFAQMTESELKFLNERCIHDNKTHPEQLTWHHYCGEPGSKDVVSLGYGWQAEFRSYHIWNHPVLKPYKYMFWIDTDARIGKIWDKDPFEMMIENDLTLLYGGFPYGRFRNDILKRKTEDVYGIELCATEKNEFGELYGKPCGPKVGYNVKQIAGAHHITNLEVYRKPIHQKFLKAFVGDYKFSRMYDDQIAVTVVAAMEGLLNNATSIRTKSWHQRSKNLTLMVHHHGMYDTSPKDRESGNKGVFFENVARFLPGLKDRCGSLYPHQVKKLEMKEREAAAKDLAEQSLPSTAANLEKKEMAISSKEQQVRHDDGDEKQVEVTTQLSTRNTTQSDRPFKKYDGPVFVTKVLSDADDDVQTVMAMLCYLQHGYNDRMNYDVIIFTTLAWKEENIKKLQDLAGADTKIIVAVEGPTLEEHFAQMSDEEVDTLHRRCNAKNDTHSKPLTWSHYCREAGSKHVNSLEYAWQAEFRSYHIWNHPALKPYKYMFWLDTDARIGKIWDKDPFEMMIENDLIILYGGYPYGKTTYPIVKKKMIDVYGKAICYSKENEYGELYAGICKDDQQQFLIRQLAGAHHITNIEVFHKPIHQEFLKRLVGDYKFSRMYDDQMAVTIVGLMEQILSDEPPGHTRLWRERRKNITLDILHHGMYDTERHEPGPRNKHGIWKEYIKRMPGLEERCKAVWEKKKKK